MSNIGSYMQQRVNEIISKAQKQNNYHFNGLYSNVAHVEDSCNASAIFAGRHHRWLFTELIYKQPPAISQPNPTEQYNLLLPIFFCNNDIYFLLLSELPFQGITGSLQQ